MQENQVTTTEGDESQARLVQHFQNEQNLPIAIAAGIGASITSAIVWAVVSVTTHFQIGFMAIGVGLLVGFAVRLGKGVTKPYGILGATLALLGCVGGNALAIVIQLFQLTMTEEKIGVLDLLPQIQPDMLASATIMGMGQTFSPIDLIFYGIAIYEGYKFSFRALTQEDVLAAQSKLGISPQ